MLEFLAVRRLKDNYWAHFKFAPDMTRASILTTRKQHIDEDRT